MAHPLALTLSCDRAVCAQAAFVGRGEISLPAVQVPESLLLAARLLLPLSRPVTHWSLSSPTWGFPRLCGCLGGIFGLEGGEPDPALDSIPPRQGGNGREVESGRAEPSGQAEGAGRAGEGARLALAS